MRRRYPPGDNYPTREMREYWESLGQFMDTFAECEAVLAFALEAYSRVSPEIAKALFSGVRTEAAASNILRILEVKKSLASDRKILQATFAQVAHINRLRNDIAHYGAKFKGEFPTVSNKRSALTRERVRETFISVDLLDGAIEDLETIIAQISLAIGKKLPSAAMYREHFGPRAQRPWRYKPAQPKPLPLPRKQKLPRRSSPA